MAASIKNADIVTVPIKRVIADDETEAMDMLSVEEPLEIRISQVAQVGSESQCASESQCGSGGQLSRDGLQEKENAARSIAITMRTPGQDQELAIGFLYTEGIISSYDQIKAIKKFGCNVLEVVLDGAIEVEPASLDRHSFIASSCGVCGKKSIEAVKARRTYSPANPFPTVDPSIIHTLPDKLKMSQSAFGTTGGIHATGLFDLSGNLILSREDVGRHNAMDKLIGACARADRLPLNSHIVMVSGRASFELVQKAAHAGATILGAVGAPSSLAVELAQNSGMTLMGFIRGDRYNIYTDARAEVTGAETGADEIAAAAGGRCAVLDHDKGRV